MTFRTESFKTQGKYMTFLVHACTDPITNITSPLYRLAKGEGNKVDQLVKLTLATFRTATAAAFFFTIIPFNNIFGRHDNLSGSLAFASQCLIHPYSASLFNAFINGGYPLMTKVIDSFVKRQLILTRDDLGGFARAIGFCYIAKCLKPKLFETSSVDKRYQVWSYKFAYWYYGKS